MVLTESIPKRDDILTEFIPNMAKTMQNLYRKPHIFTVKGLWSALPTRQGF